MSCLPQRSAKPESINRHANARNHDPKATGRLSRGNPLLHGSTVGSGPGDEAVCFGNDLGRQKKILNPSLLSDKR